MSGATKYSISEIGPNVTNAMIVAIIIGKQRTRTFPSKKGPGNDRTVWNFTIRDSPADTINVSLWGSVEFVQNLAESLHVGDVVEMINARVSFRQGGSEEKFSPSVSSEFLLSLDEVHSVLQLHGEPQVVQNMQGLLHVPTKPTTDFLTLADVERKGESSRDKESVDLLAAVLKVCAHRRIISKRDGTELHLREVLLMDYTVSGMVLTLWEPDLILRAAHWHPGHTVLFLADASVEWNDFKNRMVVSTSQRTIITEDPVSDEADTLRIFASQAPLALVDQLESVVASITDAQAINTVMSVQQLLELRSMDNQPRQVFALLYCIPTVLDLDGTSAVLTMRCNCCKAMVDERVGLCEKCISNSRLSSSFDLRVTLSDHTGSIPGVHLTGAVAEKVLGVTAEEFEKMNSDSRTILKWGLLLERCAVRVVMVRGGGGDQTIPLVSVVAMEKADPRESASRYPAN